MNRITIDITEDLDIYITQSSNGVKEKKLIDLITLTNILNASIEKKEVKNKNGEKLLYSSPLYPTFRGTSVLQHIVINRTTEYVVLHREAKKSRIAFFNSVCDNIGMPSMLFFVKLVENRMQSVKVMTVKDKVITTESELFAFPLTNVNALGQICFGQNKISEKEINHFGDLLSFPDMFLMMPSSNELSQTKTGYGLELRPLIDYLKDKDFDNDKLISVKMNYDQYLRNHVLMVSKNQNI